MTELILLSLLGEDLFSFLRYHYHRHNMKSLSLFPWQIFGRDPMSSPPVQTFTAGTRHSTSTESNRPYCFYVPNVRRFFPKRRLLCETHICKIAFLNTSLLKSSSWCSTVIYQYTNNPKFLSLPLPLISHNPVIINILIVTIYMEWFSSVLEI